jgi:histidinol dehydrogenase
MQIIRYPQPADWPQLLKRPVFDTRQLNASVQTILDAIQSEGDAAVYRYTQQFDGVALQNLEVSSADIQAAANQVPEALQQAILTAAANIRRFHLAQVQSAQPVETMPGITCWRQSVGIEKVGLYIPGGTAPLFSTILMLGIPATIAGCREIVLCSPPNSAGQLDPAILFAASVVGISKIFRIGGVQAIGAMAYGTATIPKVYKIFGPGNQYVMAAKQLVQQSGVAIDMPAGPSEVAVFADASANPAFIAADLLSQAEHGPDSQVLLVTTEESLIDSVQQALDAQLSALPRQAIAAKALGNSKLILVNSKNEGMDLLNAYAAEHLIICSDDASALAGKVINAGSVFIGHYSPESVGDYASGTNHTLPTNGYATAYSGVSLDSFVKKITFQQLTPAGLQQIAPTVTTMAEAEGLQAHARAVSIRTADPGFTRALSSN